MLVFDDKKHIRFATLPGMWERTVTVGSAGSKFMVLSFSVAHTYITLSESFNATGWRVGWLIGPAALLGPTLAATTRIVFCSVSPLQEAVAYGLEQMKERKFAEQQVREYTERRNVLCEGLSRAGIKYFLPEGSYFVLMVSFLIRI